MPLAVLDGLALAIVILLAVRMAEESSGRPRAKSHQEYLDTLLRPAAADVERISAIQVKKEREIDSKYHGTRAAQEHAAATTIQKAYRGHRERRQLDGLTLDPSARWIDAWRELRYRSATAPRYDRRQSQRRRAASSSADGRPQSPADQARAYWKRAGQIAEYAGGGGGAGGVPFGATMSTTDSQTTPPPSVFMDLRYFLEMVDERHRYGTNLQVYHEAWLRSTTDQPFFYWLDRGEGRHLELVGCSRERLDRERVRYLSKEERLDYLVQIDDDGRLRWNKNGELITTSVAQFKDSVHGIVPKDSDEPAYSITPAAEEELANDEDDSEDDGGFGSGSSTPETVVSDKSRRGSRSGIKSKAHHRHLRVSPATILNHLLRASVKPGTWIYVADTVGRLYVGIKSSGSFQHASFLSGARISSAGSIGIDDGRLVYLSPLSGHYRPTTAAFKAFIETLKGQGADLSHLRVSRAYQILLGMEYYGKTRKGLDQLMHHPKDEVRSPPRTPLESQDNAHNPLALGAARKSRRHEHEREHEHEHEHDHEHEREHKRGLARLMDDLHVRRWSLERRHSGR